MPHRTLCLLLMLTSLGCATTSATDDVAPQPDPQVQADLALLDAFDAAARAAIDTPSMESTFHAAGRQDLVKMLRRERPATEAELATARNYFQKRIEQAKAGLTWPAPPQFDIPLATAAPRIDGKLDDPAWKHAATFTQSFPLHSPDEAKDVSTTWKVLWDERHLYFGFDCRDANILAPVMPRDGDVYAADCVEMFILPRFETAVYWEIIVSPSGSVYDGLQAKPLRAWGTVTRPELNVAGLQQAVHIRGTLNDPSDRDEGYSVEVAVPFASLPEYGLARPAVGQTLRLMLVRLDRSSPSEMKIYAFTPLLSWGHNIWNHATATLAPASAAAAN